MTLGGPLVRGADGQDGKDGVDGADGEPCVAVDNHDGTKTITCPDGSEVVVQDLDALDVVVEGHLVIANPFQVTQMLMVTEVTGNLVFQSYASTAISLPNLKKVGGNLHIDNHDNLKNLSMPRLTEVGGNLSIYDNDVLEDLDGFSALETIGGQFRITRNEALTSLDGLQALHKIGSDLTVSHNTNLCQADVDAWFDAFLLTGEFGGTHTFSVNSGRCR